MTRIWFPSEVTTAPLRPKAAHIVFLGPEKGVRHTPVEVLASVLSAELCLLHPSCIGASAALSPNNPVSVPETVRDQGNGT